MPSVTLTVGHAVFMTLVVVGLLLMTNVALPRLLGTSDGRTGLRGWRFGAWALACGMAVYVFRDLVDRVGLSLRGAVEYFALLAIAIVVAVAGSAHLGRRLRLRDHRDERLATLTGGIGAIVWYLVQTM